MRCQYSCVILATVCLTLVGRAETAAPSAPRDPQIDRIVAEISPANIEANIRRLVGFKTRHTLSDTTSPDTGIGAARNWIKGEFERYSRESGGRLAVAFDAFLQPPTPPRVMHEVEIVNVVATLRGRQAESAERVYVVSGHYDSRSLNPLLGEPYAPGANDDASGTAAVMELARVMAKYEFDATIVFMTVAAEEQGLLGAKHWADQAKKNNVNVAAMFTNDIIGSSRADDGRVDDTHVRLFAEGVPPAQPMPEAVLSQIKTGGENDFAPRQLARAIRETALTYVPQMQVQVVYRRDRFLRGGDHSPFLDAGFAAVRFTEPNEDYRHQHEDPRMVNGVQHGDLPEFDDFNYIANVARVNAAALANLASAPASPANVEVETLKLENDTVLRWTANAEPDLAGYRIVWRETTSPFWEHNAWAGNVTRYTVKGLSKDNFLFGVEAVDQSGHASPAVYPKPAKQ